MMFFTQQLPDFKTQYYNHTHCFRNQSICKAAKLSKFVWKCKDARSIPFIHWRLVCSTSLYKYRNDYCNLCLVEKFAILRVDPETTLSKRTNVLVKCWHRNKFKLKNLKPWLLALPSNPILISFFLPCIQLYIDIICCIVHLKLHLIFTLPVSFFQHTV